MFYRDSGYAPAFYTLYKDTPEWFREQIKRFFEDLPSFFVNNVRVAWISRVRQMLIIFNPVMPDFFPVTEL